MNSTGDCPLQPSNVSPQAVVNVAAAASSGSIYYPFYFELQTQEAETRDCPTNSYNQCQTWSADGYPSCAAAQVTEIVYIAQQYYNAITMLETYYDSSDHPNSGVQTAYEDWEGGIAVANQFTNLWNPGGACPMPPY